jgi:hypothetical protein
MKIKIENLEKKTVPFTNKTTGQPDSFDKYTVKLADGYHELKGKNDYIATLSNGMEIEVLLQERIYNGKSYIDYKVVVPESSPSFKTDTSLKAEQFSQINGKLDEILSKVNALLNIKNEADDLFV